MNEVVSRKTYEAPAIEDHGPINDLTATGQLFSACKTVPPSCGVTPARIQYLKVKIRWWKSWWKMRSA